MAIEMSHLRNGHTKSDTGGNEEGRSVDQPHSPSQSKKVGIDRDDFVRTKSTHHAGGSFHARQGASKNLEAERDTLTAPLRQNLNCEKKVTKTPGYTTTSHAQTKTLNSDAPRQEANFKRRVEEVDRGLLTDLSHVYEASFAENTTEKRQQIRHGEEIRFEYATGRRTARSGLAEVLGIIQNILQNGWQKIKQYLRTALAPMVAIVTGHLSYALETMPEMISQPIARLAANIGYCARSMGMVLIRGLEAMYAKIQAMYQSATSRKVSDLLQNKTLGRLGLALIGVVPTVPVVAFASPLGVVYYAGFGVLLCAGIQYALTHEFEAVVSMMFGIYACHLGLQAGQAVAGTAAAAVLHILGALAGQRVAETVHGGTQDLLEFAADCGGGGMAWCRTMAGRVDICLNILGALGLIVSGASLTHKLYRNEPTPNA